MGVGNVVYKYFGSDYSFYLVGPEFTTFNSDLVSFLSLEYQIKIMNSPKFSSLPYGFSPVGKNENSKYRFSSDPCSLVTCSEAYHMVFFYFVRLFGNGDNLTIGNSVPLLDYSQDLSIKEYLEDFKPVELNPYFFVYDYNVLIPYSEYCLFYSFTEQNYLCSSFPSLMFINFFRSIFFIYFNNLVRFLSFAG